MILYWKKYKPGEYSLFRRPAGEPRWPVGSLRGSQSRGYSASFWNSDGAQHSIWFRGASVSSARKALERELDKRSIGLFGDDILSFAEEPAHDAR